MSGVLQANVIPVGAFGKYIKNILVATEDIPQFKVATTTGKVADSDNVYHRDNLAGIVLVTIASGFSGSVVTEGEIENPSWNFVSSAIIYVNGTIISTNAPTSGVSTMIGHGTSDPTKIYVKIYRSVLL